MNRKTRQRWTKPAWMVQKYITPMLNCQGDITPEHAMNCRGEDCNLSVNAPRALMCVSVSSQVKYLLRLKEAGLLKPSRVTPTCDAQDHSTEAEYQACRICHPDEAAKGKP